MRPTARAAILAGILGLAASVLGAAQPPQPVVEIQKIKVPVKHYKVLTPADVYRAVVEGAQADVQFQDGFAGRADVPEGASRFELAGQSYQVAAAFRTETGLVCLVPASNPDVLRMLFGLPLDWELSSVDLQRQIALNQGQLITVLGTVVGAAFGEKYVMADAVFTGEPSRPTGQREVRLLWPTERDPRVIGAVGSQSLSFPCTWARGKTVTVKVAVRQATPQILMNELARLAALSEGLVAGSKAYGIYLPDAVYRYAGERNAVNVDFVDTVADVFRLPLPESLAAAPTVIEGQPAMMAVSQAFRTRGRITCLVPAASLTLTRQAAGVLPGEQVRIRGTAVGPQGAYNCVLVDYIGFPAQEALPGGGDIWWVSVEWPGMLPRNFWDYGVYELRDLPCQNYPGRYEALQIILGEYREEEVQVLRVPAPTPPAPAPEPEEEPEEEPAEPA